MKKSLYGLKQSSRAWVGCFASVIQEFGLRQLEKDHSVFWRIQLGKRILLIIHINDIVITGNDTEEIDSLKKHLQAQFQIKDLGSLKYFLGIEVVRSKKSILLSQRKYVLDLLSEVGMLGCRSIDSPMDVKTKLLSDQDERLEDVGAVQEIGEKTDLPDGDQTGHHI